MLKLLHGQQRALGARKRGVIAPGFDNDASLYLAQLGGVTRNYANAVNRLFGRLKATQLWPMVRSGYLFCGPTAAASVKNIVPGVGDAVVSGPTHSAYKGFSGVGDGSGGHVMQFAGTNTGFAVAGGHGYVFAGRVNIGKGASDYNQSNASWGNDSFNILISGSNNSYCQGLKFDNLEAMISGRGAWFGGSPPGQAGRAVFGEGTPIAGEFSPTWGYSPRTSSARGYGFWGNVGGLLRIYPAWPNTVPRHSVWLFVDTMHANFPNNGMQALTDMVSDFCDEMGCID